MNAYYIEGWTVCEGAADEEETFSSWDDFASWAELTIADMRHLGVEGAVYYIEHEHEEGIDCECVQYLTDHSPYLSTEG